MMVLAMKVMIIIVMVMVMVVMGVAHPLLLNTRRRPHPRTQANRSPNGSLMFECHRFWSIISSAIISGSQFWGKLSHEFLQFRIAFAHMLPVFVLLNKCLHDCNHNCYDDCVGDGVDHDCDGCDALTPTPTQANAHAHAHMRNTHPVAF